MLDIQLEGVQDEISRENFRRIKDESNSNPLTKGKLRVLEVTALAAVTNAKFPHGLSFTPKDVIITRQTGAGQLTVNYDKIDGTNLDYTTTGACVVRLLCGSFG